MSNLVSKSIVLAITPTKENKGQVSIGNAPFASLISVLKLQESGIEEDNWKLAKEPTFDYPLFADISYKNGFSIVADPTRLIFEDKQPNSKEKKNIDDKMILFLKQMPPSLLAVVNAVGINSKYKTKYPENIFSNIIKDLEIKDYSEPQQLKMALRKNESNILNLDITNIDEGKNILVDINQHYDVKNAEEIKKVLNLAKEIRIGEETIFKQIVGH